MFAPPAAAGAAAAFSAEGPSAPPASMFDSMPGYEGTVAGGGTVSRTSDILFDRGCHNNVLNYKLE